ncbi:hypothetical protein AAZX31_07G213300 [Glycine max]
MVGCSRKQTFNYIKDRMWKNMNSWRGKKLSMEMREIILKFVAHAILAYAMSIYLFSRLFGRLDIKVWFDFWLRLNNHPRITTSFIPKFDDLSMQDLLVPGLRD